MTIKKTTMGDNIILAVDGRVDATTSAELQHELTSVFQDNNKVIIDCEKLEYISSAGLRVLLMGHKMAVSKSGYLKLINVSEVVMEVLEMTGFSDILTISKV
jgi:anti-anti-sigma factor